MFLAEGEISAEQYFTSSVFSFSSAIRKGVEEADAAWSEGRKTLM